MTRHRPTPLEWLDLQHGPMVGRSSLADLLRESERRRVRAERRLLVVIALAIVAVTVAIGVGL